ncbi:hypothetical protein F7734_53590 [Scytonema sp. UIC 10036]|uniref:hypothetical protein n=1 Tax=Scytonema sp. UIC 10036 TaxID=2304196 RepID=UPI0012DA92A6|nr:hypothetical protein [Scytonema sp. UIC 10036]MUH00642.1 hypothetical protein [Scytonema sp. UIC 10036]
MEPLQYYASGEHLDRLCERFGPQLDLLNRPQKLQLRAILTYFVMGKEMMGDEYSINDALVDSLQHLFVEDPELEECMDILQGLSVRDAESLQVALVEQCRTGNARLKTPVETTTDDLTQRGVPQDLARQVAYITHKVDPTRQRTVSEQETINKVHKILIGQS